MASVVSIKTECYAILRAIKNDLLTKKLAGNIKIKLNPTQLDHITNVEYNAILELEKEFKSQITLTDHPSLSINQYKIEKK